MSFGSSDCATGTTCVRNLVPCSSMSLYLSELKVNCRACRPPLEHRGTGRHLWSFEYYPYIMYLGTVFMFLSYTVHDHLNIILTLCTWVLYLCSFLILCMLCVVPTLSFVHVCLRKSTDFWVTPIEPGCFRRHICLGQQFVFVYCEVRTNFKCFQVNQLVWLVSMC